MGKASRYILLILLSVTLLFLLVPVFASASGESQVTDEQSYIDALAIEEMPIIDSASDPDAGDRPASDTDAQGIWGDVDYDDEVTSFDASLILQYEVGLIGENDLFLKYADVDSDGDVTSFDASLILQYEVGLINRLPLA